MGGETTSPVTTDTAGSETEARLRGGASVPGAGRHSRGTPDYPVIPASDRFERTNGGDNTATTVRYAHV